MFFKDDEVYVSNTRVVIRGTTYSTANITSVRKMKAPAKNGCAALFTFCAAMVFIGGIMNTVMEKSDGPPAAVVSAIFFVAGILWLRSIKPTFHVMLASASGERQGLSSQYEGFVDHVTSAIADAISYRG